MVVLVALLRRVGVATRSPLAARIRTRFLTDGAKTTPTPPTGESNVLLGIQKQVSNELATANESSAKLYGFVGACCNWFLGLSAVYDASCKGPELISLKMTGVMLCYSTLFGRWCHLPPPLPLSPSKPRRSAWSTDQTIARHPTQPPTQAAHPSPI